MFTVLRQTNIWNLERFIQVLKKKKTTLKLNIFDIICNLNRYSHKHSYCLTIRQLYINLEHQLIENSAAVIGNTDTLDCLMNTYGSIYNGYCLLLCKPSQKLLLNILITNVMFLVCK